MLLLQCVSFSSIHFKASLCLDMVQFGFKGPPSISPWYLVSPYRRLYLPGLVAEEGGPGLGQAATWVSVCQ